MTTLYQSTNHWNHYYKKSSRAPWWDYGKNGVYFVTICTQNRLPLLGTIREGHMELSEIGALVRDTWMEIPRMMGKGVHLEAFVIMPNHIHGIVVFDRAKEEEHLQDDADGTQMLLHPKAQEAITRQAFFKKISPKKGSLPHLIRKVKGLVTRQARLKGYLAQDQPLWQARYYDRIVRDEKELGRLTVHIAENTANWVKDDYYYPASKSDAPKEQPTAKVEDHSCAKDALIGREDKGSSKKLLYTGHRLKSLLLTDPKREETRKGLGGLLFEQRGRRQT